MSNKKSYSPKENLGLLIIANEKVKFKTLENLVVSLKEVTSQYKSKSEILEKIDNKLIVQIENYWNLKEIEVIAYGYLVFNHFMISQEEITPENITKNFIYQMRFHSPENAVDFVKRNFGMDFDTDSSE